MRRSLVDPLELEELHLEGRAGNKRRASAKLRAGSSRDQHLVFIGMKSPIHLKLKPEYVPVELRSLAGIADRDMDAVILYETSNANYFFRRRVSTWFNLAGWMRK